MMLQKIIQGDVKFPFQNADLRCFERETLEHRIPPTALEFSELY